MPTYERNADTLVNAAPGGDTVRTAIVDRLNEGINDLYAVANTIDSFLQSGTGANSRTVQDKLRDFVSVFDFMTEEQISDVKSFTCSVDVTNAIQSALNIRGDIYFPKGVYLISAPLLLRRGTRIYSSGTIDTEHGRGAIIKLSDGSNCEMLQTELAAGVGVATHYYAIDGIVLDGNVENQTEAHDAIQFWGAYIGSYLRYVFIRNVYGKGLSLDGGVDVQIDHVWVNGCVVGADGYAFDTNQEVTTAGSISGMLNINHLYVENTAIDKVSVAGAPSTTVANRANGMRLCRLAAANLNDVHIEGAALPISLASCYLVNAGKVTGAYIGNDALADHTFIRIDDGDVQSVNIGIISVTTNGESGMYAVRKKDGLSSNFHPNARLTAVSGKTPACVGYSAYGAASTVDSMLSPAGFRSRMSVYKEGGNGAIARLMNGQEDTGSVEYSFLKNEGLYTRFGSNVSQPTSTEKTFIEFQSYGNTGDRVKINEPFTTPVRAGAGSVEAGAIWRTSTSFGSGVGPFYQRAGGSNDGADHIATVRRGSGAPSVNADYIGQLYVDTTSTPRAAYVAIAFGSGSSDWLKIT